MRALTRPPRVRAGDTVAIVSPSLGAVGLWPHRVERATAYLEEDAKDAKALWEVVAARTDRAGIPVLANGEIGHTDPMVTVPLGSEAGLDASGRRFRLTRAPTATPAAT